MSPPIAPPLGFSLSAIPWRWFSGSESNIACIQFGASSVVSSVSDTVSATFGSITVFVVLARSSVAFASLISKSFDGFFVSGFTSATATASGSGKGSGKGSSTGTAMSCALSRSANFVKGSVTGWVLMS